MHVSTKMAPKREDRLHACIAYGGTLEGIKKQACCGCMRDGEREFTQGSICLMLPGIAMLNSLPDNVNLLHGAIGCGVCSHSQNANTRSGNAARFGAVKDGIWISTAMNEVDVIGGGEAKLKRALIEADRVYRPKTITVVASCVPGITGDDVEGLISQVQPQVSARIIPVHCEGFKTKIWATAYDAVYHGLAATLLDEPTGRQRILKEEGEGEAFELKARAQNTVNLLNVSSMGKVDEDELIRLLQALGYEVHVFPVFAKPEEMYRIRYAALNISTCPTHDDYFLKLFEQAYHIPFILRHMPIGIANTNAWLLDVAAFFQKEALAKRLISRESERLTAALDKYRCFFAGKRVFVNAGEFRALATAELLVELGFTVVGVRSFHHDEFAKDAYESLHKAAGDVAFNIANCQPYEEANLLKKLKPDLFLGHWNGNSTAAKLGIPSHVIYNTGLSYIGYRGAFELARRLYRQLSNPAFARNLSAYARLPYRETWYAQDPFTYIHGGNGHA